MLADKIIYTKGDEIPEWNQENCYQIITTNNFSQSVVFFRKLRRNFLVTKLYLYQRDDQFDIKALTIDPPFIENKVLLDPTFSCISKQENMLILTYYHEIKITTLYYYLTLLLKESIQFFLDIDFFHLFCDLKNLKTHADRISKEVKFHPWRIIISPEASLQILRMPEFDNIAEKMIIDIENSVLSELCHLVNLESLNEIENSSGYTKISPVTMELIKSHEESNGMVIEDNSSKFLGEKKIQIDEILFKIFEIIMDAVPLGRTMQDHFFLNDILLLRDIHQKLKFWEFYNSKVMDPLKMAERLYLYGRWASACLDDTNATEYYEKSKKIINKENLQNTLVYAALLDAFACYYFVQHDYMNSRLSLYKSLEIIQGLYGSNSFISAIIYSNLTHVQVRILNQEEARKCTEKAIEITLLYKKVDDIFFSVLHGNKIILTDDDQEKQENFKRVIELKRRYWDNYHPNVILSFYNFYYIAERAFGTNFEFKKYVEFEEIRFRSHLNYYGENHSSVLTSVHTICSTFLNTNETCKLLKFLKKLEKEYKPSLMMPLIEEYKCKVIRKVGNPQIEEYLKRQRAKGLYYKKQKTNIMPDYFDESFFVYVRLIKDLLKNKLYLDDITIT